MKKIFVTVFKSNLFFLLCIIISIAPALCQINTSSLELLFQKAGLVDVKSIEPAIRVNILYSTDNNIFGKKLYDDLTKCYLQKEVAYKLAEAQKNLQVLMPGYRLLVFDGARPRRVQYKMWALVSGTAKQWFVARPGTGSMHNYGAAVDLTILDNNGRDLDMGTPYDYFGDLARPDMEEKFFMQRKLTKDHLANRRLLRKIMLEAGFKMIPNEWWHFDGFHPEIVKKKYQIIE